MKRPNINMGSTKSRYFSDVELQQISLTIQLLNSRWIGYLCSLKAFCPTPACRCGPERVIGGGHTDKVVLLLIASDE